MVKLRFKRMGRKFGAYYRIVAADALSRRDGRFIEEVGFYNPHTKETKINEAIYNKWIKQGAVPTQTVANLFKKYKSNTAVEIAKINNIPVKKVKPKKKKIKTKGPIEVSKEETTE